MNSMDTFKAIILDAVNFFQHTHYRNAASAQSHLKALFKLPIIGCGTFSGKFFMQ